MATADADSTSNDNVTRFPAAGADAKRAEGVPTPRSKRRSGDRRNAARQARYRSKNKGDRYAKAAKDASSQPHVDAPTIAPTVMPTVTEAATAEPREASNGVTAKTNASSVPVARTHNAAIDVAAYSVAVALAAAAAFFSIRGMVVIFPGSPVPVGMMAIAMESAKLVTAGWLARRWSTTAKLWRAALVVFVFGLAVINAAGVYAQLVSAHVGERGEAASALETQDAALAAKIDVQVHKVGDLDRRLGQIDDAIEEATRHGRTKTAPSAIDSQRKARGSLVEERDREAGTLAALKTERASVAANGRQIETEAAPIQYVASIFGVADPEIAIRWLIALMVLCCDPLAIALTAAASARRSTIA
jgi:hypothetical protein